MKKSVEKMLRLVGVSALVVVSACTSKTMDAHGTAVSMALKEDERQIPMVQSKDGDLYRQLLHHGPAVENLWVAYRIYFNKYLSVDILSKFQPRLELTEGKWYGGTSPELAVRSFGKDNYKVGKTVGLGGVRLWDANASEGGQTVLLDTSASARGMRAAQVTRKDSYSKIYINNASVPYQGRHVDIDIELTVFDEKRHALVEVTVHGDTPVQFVTGLVVHDKLMAVEKTDNYLLTWGDYDSPAASEAFAVGAGLVFDPTDIDRQFSTSDEMLLVTHPRKSFRYLITSANQKEHLDLNHLVGFQTYLGRLGQEFPDQ